MIRRSLLALTLLAAACASAQTVTTTINLSWVAPTANTDGSAITGPLTYTLYQGPKAGPFTQAAAGLSGTTTVVTSTAAGTCFALAASEVQGSSTVSSTLSPTVCALQPDAPTSLAVSVSILVK